MTNDQDAWVKKMERLAKARDKVAALVEALRDAHGDKENAVEMKVWNAVIKQARNVR